MKNLITIGNRIPHKYFITTGKGESDAGSKFLPAETGSYDAALTDAGIQNANIVKYTSVMPTKTIEIKREDGVKKIQWGEVLESIMSQANGKRGEVISAAVMTSNVYDVNGKFLGGFACEYAGDLNEEKAINSLLISIAGIIERRGYGSTNNQDLVFKKDITTDKGYTYHPGYKYAWSSMKVQKKHGTVLAGICFQTYKIPVLSLQATKKNNNKKYNKRRLSRRK